jgi:hypothetical protein
VDRDWCGPFEPGVLSYWRRDSVLFMNFDVGPVSSPVAPAIPEGTTVNPDWRTFLYLQVRPGTP